MSSDWSVGNRVSTPQESSQPPSSTGYAPATGQQYPYNPYGSNRSLNPVDLTSCIFEGFLLYGIPLAAVGCGVMYYVNSISPKPLPVAQLRNRFILIAFVNSTLGEIIYMPVCQKKKQAQHQPLPGWSQMTGYGYPQQQQQQQQQPLGQGPSPPMPAYGLPATTPGSNPPTGPITYEEGKRILMTQVAQRSLTPEQRLMLSQCSREALWYRSLPLCVICWGGLSAARAYAPLPLPIGVGWYLGVGLLGWAIGRISYGKECEGRLVRQIVDAVNNSQAFGTPQLQYDPSQSQYNPPAAQTQEEEGSSQVGADSKSSTITYDELRRKNRNEHMRPWSQSYQNTNTQQPQVTGQTDYYNRSSSLIENHDDAAHSDTKF